MTTFSDARSYILAAFADSGLAIVPFQLVADALDVSRAAVEGQVRANKLEAIKIGRTRYVTLRSIRRQLEDWENEVATVRAFLERAAKDGTLTLAYDPVMGVIGRKTSTPNDRTVIGKILGQISRESYKQHGFLLSSMVVQKQTGEPSDAFYGLAGDIDPSADDYDTWKEYHNAQLALIAAHYKPE
ncbi:hypothetical protein [Sphingomonas hankookensis]|uniref:hypothetical protein n=1 Tax=Sphingomonas hankookensis TaxID=563996 RepID=UPI00234F7B63|nr:hypothetical protein [Sphingomonas hankookensis]WCP72198.1 hypothetical protein PPZ50_01130 [Sphingomonas hankookensis]